MTAVMWGPTLQNFVCFPGRVEKLDSEWIALRACWDRWLGANRDQIAAQSVNSVRISDGDEDRHFEIIYNPPDSRYRVTCNGRVIDQGESVPI